MRTSCDRKLTGLTCGRPVPPRRGVCLVPDRRWRGPRMNARRKPSCTRDKRATLAEHVVGRAPEGGIILSVRDWIVGEKQEKTDGETDDTQDRAPILEALQTYISTEPTSFDVPGHQAGKAAPHSITRLIGKDVFAADTTTQKGLD